MLSVLYKNTYERIKIEKAKKLLIIWKNKVILSRFQKIKDCNQKIREIVPIIWVINSAINKDKDRENARRMIGERTEYRFSTRYEENNNLEIPDYYSEEYTRIQYIYNPNISILDYINTIERKCYLESTLELSTKNSINKLIKNITLPELLQEIFTKDILEVYGY
jgi:hypothetical protein